MAIQGLASFYAAGIVLGLAATTIIVAVKTLMSHWFDRNQGLSLGVVMMGSSVAGIVLPFFAAAALLSWVQPTYRNQLVCRGIENVADISPLDHTNARTS